MYRSQEQQPLRDLSVRHQRALQRNLCHTFSSPLVLRLTGFPMKIEAITLREIQMPLVHFFETSFGRTYTRQILLLPSIAKASMDGQNRYRAKAHFSVPNGLSPAGPPSSLTSLRLYWEKHYLTPPRARPL